MEETRAEKCKQDLTEWNINVSEELNINIENFPESVAIEINNYLIEDGYTLEEIRIARN